MANYGLLFEKRPFSLLAWWGLSLCFLCCPLRLCSQATSGSIEGLVTDPSGARVPGAALLIREGSSGIEARGRSNSLGEYAITGLPPGSYTITVDKQGFRQFNSPPTPLAIDQKLRADVSLLLGSMESPVVQVTAPLCRRRLRRPGRPFSPARFSIFPCWAAIFSNCRG